MARYRSVFPRAKPVIYILPGRPGRRTGMLSPILKLVVVASVALAVMASVMTSGRAHEACEVGPGGESRTFDLGHLEGDLGHLEGDLGHLEGDHLGHLEGCGQPPTTLAKSTPS